MPKRTSKPISLLLVEDHEIVRVALRTLLEKAEGIQVVGDTGTAGDAIEEAVRLKPDVVLMDVQLPGGSGVNACREIRSASPNTRVLFLTSFADENTVEAAVLGGADGYLHKEIGRATLLRAIRTVAEGRSVLDPAVTRTVLNRLRTLQAEGKGEPLSDQERRVLALVAEGKTNKEIAGILQLSDKTVKNYLSNVYDKLQVTRRSQAAAFYARHSTP
jgi:two-component system, NarL family, response regulator DevR